MEVLTPESDGLLLVLVQVCLHYNKGSGPHGDCSFQENCSKVHLCQHFVQGACMFGHACKRRHVMEPHAQRKLEERGLSADIIQDLPWIYRNLHVLTAAAAGQNQTSTGLTRLLQRDDPTSEPAPFLLLTKNS